MAVACGDGTGPNGIRPLDTRQLLTYLQSLADDSMQGRRAGSAYELEAARYVADQFRREGLEPGVPGFLLTFAIPWAVDGREGLSSQDVLAEIAGSGRLADEWIVVGAHYDHLGVQQTAPGESEVFNGADDNASGTALLLEVARYLQDSLATMSGNRRSLLFVAFGGEETGLAGSRYYCENPTVPMDRIVAMVNFDMVGRLRENGLWLIGTQSSSTGWADLIRTANAAGLPITYDEKGVSSSDQYCFYVLRRPVALLHTGLHAQYHTPEDDVALEDVDGMKTVGEFALRLLSLVLTPEMPLEFTGP